MHLFFFKQGTYFQHYWCFQCSKIYLQFWKKEISTVSSCFVSFKALVYQCLCHFPPYPKKIWFVIGKFLVPYFRWHFHVYFLHFTLTLKFAKLLFSLSMTSHPAPNLFGSARDKAELFRERYIILQQVRKRGKGFIHQIPKARIICSLRKRCGKS